MNSTSQPNELVARFLNWEQSSRDTSDRVILTPEQIDEYAAFLVSHPPFEPTKPVSKARRHASSIRRKALTQGGCVCNACLFEYVPIVQLHHLHPLSESDLSNYDPEDDPELVWLCPNCHALVHEIRRVYQSDESNSRLRKRRKLLDNWLDNVCDPAVAKRLRAYANEIDALLDGVE